MRRPESRIHLNRFAIQRDGLLIPAIEHQMMRDERVTLSIGGIDLPDFFEPRIRRMVGQNFETGLANMKALVET